MSDISSKSITDAGQQARDRAEPDPTTGLPRPSDVESFIPFSRRDLREAVLADHAFAASHGAGFTDFCRLLEAWLHHDYHARLETLKADFAHLDPDRDTIARSEPGREALARCEAELATTLRGVLERANYRPLSESQLAAAMAGRSLIDLDLRIDFDDFGEMLFYWRGASTVPRPPGPKWKFWQKPGQMDVFQRVVLLIRFKDADYFAAKGFKPEQLRFTPGKMYLYLYKLIPQLDLEVLFPNVESHMTLKDRVLFGLPAIGAAVPMLLKALPQLLLVAGVIVFLAFGPEAVRRLGITGAQVNSFLPILVALLSLAVVFGGFAVKQYLSYKNKKLKFLKDVTDTLFFRNLVSNAGVFHALVDAAEEEEAKEIMLASYVLLNAEGPLTAAELDARIEAWLADEGVTVDFDVDKALNTMQSIRHGDQALLTREGDTLRLLPLDQACALLDRIWDGLYDFG